MSGRPFVTGCPEALQQSPAGLARDRGRLDHRDRVGVSLNNQRTGPLTEGQGQPYAPPTPKRDGFWRGLFVTWTIVVAAQLAAFRGTGFADLLPRPEQSRTIFSLLVLALVPAHVAVPALGGTVYSLVW